MAASLTGGPHLLLSLSHTPGDGAGEQVGERGQVGQVPQAIGRLPAEPLARVDVARRIDGDEHPQAVSERADLAVAAAEALAHLVEGRDADLAAMFDVAVQHLAEQRAVLLGRNGVLAVQNVHRRDCGVDREVHPLGKEEVEDLLPPGGGVRRERGDAADAHAVAVCPADALHRPGEVALPTLAVGDVLGTVQAGADLDLVLGEELAELVVQKPEVALQVDFVPPPPKTPLNALQRLPPEVVPRLERLPAVERDLDLPLRSLPNDPRHEVQRGFHGLGRHERTVVRPETV